MPIMGIATGVQYPWNILAVVLNCTGTFMAVENFGVKADIVCMAKALGGGLPLGATLSSSFGDVRGLGLMIGVEIVKPDGSIDSDIRDRIVVDGFKEGIVLLPCGDSVIRFSPPLVITKDEADTGLDKFEEALKNLSF